MIFNANKFGKKKSSSGVAGGGGDSANNSISPSRRGTTSTPIMGDRSSKSPKLSARGGADGQSMISANSSGKFSVRNVFGGGPAGTNESH